MCLPLWTGPECVQVASKYFTPMDCLVILPNPSTKTPLHSFLEMLTFVAFCKRIHELEMGTLIGKTWLVVQWFPLPASSSFPVGCT